MAGHIEKCAVSDCPKPARNAGWCWGHYYRNRRHGSPLLLAPRREPRPLEDRFWSKVERHETTECWPWKAGISPDGYGRFYWRGAADNAHRVAWILTFGEIPDGMHVDHRCHDPLTCRELSACPHRRCINPAHLAVVPASANLTRRVHHGRTNAPHGIDGKFIAGKKAS